MQEGRTLNAVGAMDGKTAMDGTASHGRVAVGGWRGFARGALEALGFIAAFVAGGLLWATQLAGAAPGAVAPALYAPAMEEEATVHRVWLVDGYNLLNVGLLAGHERDGWWSGEHRRELLERVAAFDDPDARIWVVFDGPRPGDESPVGRVRAIFAPNADDFLLARIRSDAGERVALVTADRRLADRARRRGAEVVAPAAFLARCPALG